LSKGGESICAEIVQNLLKSCAEMNYPTLIGAGFPAIMDNTYITEM